MRAMGAYKGREKKNDKRKEIGRRRKKLSGWGGDRNK